MDMMRTVAIAPDEFYPEETLIRSVGTNVLLPLHPNAGDPDAMPYVMGASAPRRVLGILHLTNYRLKFKSAEEPPVSFSIFLPAIARADNTSFLLVRKFRITMKDDTHIDFVMWGIRPFLKILNTTRTKAASLNWETIGADIAAAEGKAGDWMVA